MKAKKYNVYPVLEQESNMRGISKASMAEFLGITSKTFYQKANGVSPFMLEEAKAIQKEFFPDVPLTTLFERGGND